MEEVGANLLHLLYVFRATANTLGRLVVKITADGGDIDILTGDALAYLAGYGMTGEEPPWDGNLDLEDTYDRNIPIPNVTINTDGILDLVESIAVQEPTKMVLSEVTSAIFRVPVMTVVSADDLVTVTLENA